MNTRAWKRCGAPTWSPHSPYCRDHRASFEKRQLWPSRPRQARGYGAAHKAMRERYAALVATGLAVCARCGTRSLRAHPSTWAIRQTGRAGRARSIRVATARRVEDRRGGHEPVPSNEAAVPSVVTRCGRAAPRLRYGKEISWGAWGSSSHLTKADRAHLVAVCTCLLTRTTLESG